MVKSSRGFRSSTRRKLKKSLRDKFKPGRFIKEFKTNDKVVIKQDPSSQRGMPHPRFKGKVGVVTERRGNSYILEIYMGNKRKTVVSRPEHLKKI